MSDTQGSASATVHVDPEATAQAVSAAAEFVDNPDAMVWAQEFARRVEEGMDPTDTGILVGWFANAMGCGERNAPATKAEVRQMLDALLASDKGQCDVDA